MEVICTKFMANAWKKDLCTNCQRHESEHSGETIPCRSKTKNNDARKGSGSTISQQEVKVTQLAAASATSSISRPQQAPPAKPDQLHKPTKSKLPTRSVPSKYSDVSSTPSSNSTVSTIAQGQQGSKNRVTSAPPKPQRAVGRSESARCKPTPAAKPVGLQAKSSLARATSQRQPRTGASRATRGADKTINKSTTCPETSVIPQETPGERADGTRNTASSEEVNGEAMSTIVGSKENVEEVSEDTTGDTEFHEQQTLRNTLRNLNLEPDKINVKDIDGLHKTFLNLQEHEHMHESPFHNVTAKIRYHHNKHSHRHHHHGSHHQQVIDHHTNHHPNHHADHHHAEHPNHHVEAQQSSVKEPFYGSADVTSTNCRPTSVYDNVVAKEEKTPVKLQVDTAGYDNAKVTVFPQQNTSCSPKYDPVPKEMTLSHESNQSERIYAEVTDIIITDPEAETEIPAPEYEELSVCLSNAKQQAKSLTLPVGGETIHSVLEKDSQTKQAPTSKSALQQPHIQCVTTAPLPTAISGSAASSRSTNKMSFFKTFLKKGKKSETIGHSTGQKLEQLEKNSKHSSYVKGKQMVVDNWVMEQNSTNRLDINSTNSSPSASIPDDIIAEKDDMISSKTAHSKRPGLNAALSVSVDHMITGKTSTKGETKSESLRGSVSPRESLQRPDKKPPPPPTSSTSTKSDKTKRNSDSVLKLADKRISQLSINNNIPIHQDVKGNKLVLTKDRNGDFIPGPVAPDPANKKKVKIDDRPDGLYDEPWSDVDTVITRSILKMEESVSKSTGRLVSKQFKVPEPLRLNGKKAVNVHTRQISMPDTRRVGPMKDLSKSGKVSPLSATDSGYESNSTTTTIQRGHSSASDLTHNRISALPSSASLRSVVTKPTPIDSLPMCLDQIGALNVLTLQKLLKTFLQRDSLAAQECDIEWKDLSIEDGSSLMHSNNRCVFYKGHLNHQPAQSVTIMLSLKKPETCKTYSPNLLNVSQQFRSTGVDQELLPPQLVKAFRASSSPNNSDSDSGSDKLSEETTSEDTKTYVTVLPHHHDIDSVLSFIKSRDSNAKSEEHLVMDSLYILLQVINIIFALAERQLQIESLSAGDLIVSLDTDAVPTVYCHMISIKKYSADFSLTCEKLRMFLIQLTHASEKLTKSKNFNTVEDLIKSSSDAGDLKTIGLIIQYLLWGPKEDEVKVMSVAENRKQAFDLWLHLSRAKMLNELVFQAMDKLKIYTMANFLSNTSGPELFKITKLLSTY